MSPLTIVVQREQLDDLSLGCTQLACIVEAVNSSTAADAILNDALGGVERYARWLSREIDRMPG